MKAGAAPVGDVDATSLFARFAFDRDAPMQAAHAWRQSLRPGFFPPKAPEFATYVHELTHYLQYVTTPYGIFLHLLRLLQNQSAVDLIRDLLGRGLTIEMPLSGRVSLPAGSAGTPAHQAYAAWWNLEYLIALLEGDRQRQLDIIEMFVDDVEHVGAGEAPFHPYLMDLRGCFAWAQARLTAYIRALNAEGTRNDPHPIFPDEIDDAALAAESQRMSPWDFHDAGFEAVAATVGFPIDTSAVIESAAVAAELYQSDTTFDRLRSWLARPVTPERDLYRRCLRFTLDSIRTQDISAFLLSHMALCEIAMFPPLLPQHAALRGAAGASFEQLLPWRRFEALLSVTGKVEPMRDRADHARYVGELVPLLGWVHPDAIVHASLVTPARVRNPIAFLYRSAQRWREWDRTCFIGIDALLVHPDPKAVEWRLLFDFLIVDYADRTTYHRDKDFLRSMTTRYLETLGLQTVMRGNSLTIPAPYSRGEEEKAWMTDWLRRRFEDFFPGVDFSALVFV